jgi:hypothetical protein
MKKVMIAAALPALALGATAAHARTSAGPVACIYEGVDHNRTIDKDALHALVAKNLNAQTSKEKDINQAIGQQVAVCRAKYGWGKAHQDAAVHYLESRLFYDAQSDLLKKYGVTFDMLDTITSGFTPEQRETFTHGTVSGTMIDGIISQLKSAGAKVDPLTQDDVNALYPVLDKALVAVLDEQQAITEYKSR